MKKLDKYDKLYMKSMKIWFKEEDIREEEIRKAISTGIKLSKINDKLLKVHLERRALSVKNYSDWCKEMNIKSK